MEIRTIAAWLKSTLLLKVECFDTHIYMKTECLQKKWDAAFFGAWKGEDRVVLNKSLIYTRVKRGAWGVYYKISKEGNQSRSKM